VDWLLSIGFAAALGGLMLAFILSETAPTEAVDSTGQVVPFDNHGIYYVRWFEALAFNALLAGGFFACFTGQLVYRAIFGVDNEHTWVAWLNLLSSVLAAIVGVVLFAQFVMSGGNWPQRFTP
jgi:hypothetical protein